MYKLQGEEKKVKNRGVRMNFLEKMQNNVIKSGLHMEDLLRYGYDVIDGNYIVKLHTMENGILWLKLDLEARHTLNIMINDENGNEYNHTLKLSGDETWEMIFKELSEDIDLEFY